MKPWFVCVFNTDVSNLQILYSPYLRRYFLWIYGPAGHGAKQKFHFHVESSCWVRQRQREKETSLWRKRGRVFPKGTVVWVSISSLVVKYNAATINTLLYALLYFYKFVLCLYFILTCRPKHFLLSFFFCNAFENTPWCQIYCTPLFWEGIICFKYTLVILNIF